MTFNCYPCPQGRFTELPSSTLCKLCTVGKFTEEETAHTCKPCDQGYAQPAEGQKDCIPCDVGFYQRYKQQSICSRCPAGKQALRMGARECLDCLPGYYRDENATACMQCEPGRYQPEKGAERCKEALPGTEPDPIRAQALACADSAVAPWSGLDQCINCPLNSKANDPRTWCLCNSGWVGFINASTSERTFSLRCVPCPAGGECRHRGTEWDKLEALEGWWRKDEEEMLFYRCVMPEHCLGGHNSSCGANREGPLCSLCVAGFSSATGLSPCLPCPEQTTSLGLSVLVVCFVLIGVFSMYYLILMSDRSLLQMAKDREAMVLKQLLRTAKMQEQAFNKYEAVEFETLTTSARAKPNFTYKFKILLSFFQICTNLTFVVDVPWPPLYSKFISLFSFVNLDFIPWQSLGCVARFEFYTVLMLTMATPIGMTALLICTFLIPKLRSVKHRYREENEEKETVMTEHERRVQRFLAQREKEQEAKRKAITSGEDVLPEDGKKHKTRKNNLSLDYENLTGEEMEDLIAAETDDMDQGRTRTELANTLKNIHTWLPKLTVLEKDIDPLHQAYKRTWRKFWKLVLFTLFLVYPSVSSTVVSSFVCKDINGVLYLKADFRLQCMDQTWFNYLPLAIAGLIMYPIGIPAFFLYLLLRYRNRLNQPDIQAQLGFLYQAYSHKAWWFELADMCHKLVLTSLVAFFHESFQMSAAMAFSTLYTCTVILGEPYLRKEEDQLHLLVQTELLMLLLCGYILTEFKTVTLDFATDVMLSTILILLNILTMSVTLALAGYNVYRMIYNRIRKKKLERLKMIEQEMSERKERLRIMRVRAEAKKKRMHTQVLVAGDVAVSDASGGSVMQRRVVSLSPVHGQRDQEALNVHRSLITDLEVRQLLAEQGLMDDDEEREAASKDMAELSSTTIEGI
eukprot:g2190.t1